MGRLFLSCPRNEETGWFLRACRELDVAGIGFVGIGTEQFRAENAHNGAIRPLFRELWGDGTMDYGMSGDAAEALFAASQGGDLTLLTTGPLTDVAQAILMHPSIVNNIRRILLLGGTDSYGDVTPAAERNFYNDPEAARIVLNAGIPIVLFGLNVSRDLPHPTKLLLDYLADPAQFVTEEAGAQVETHATLTLGKCVNDLYSDKQFEKKNVLFVMRRNAEPVGEAGHL